MMNLKISRKIKIALCYAIGVIVMIGTFFASGLIIENILGDGVWSVKNTASGILSFVAGIYVSMILYPPKEDEESEADESERSEEIADTVTNVWDKGEIDESVYPELFKREAAKENTEESLSFPDIKKIISEQKAEADIVQETVNTKTAWDEFVGMRETAEIKADLYADIPAELPEDYVPNYEAQTEEVEAEEEEYVPERSIKGIIVKAVVAVILCALAVLLPSRLMTVYTEDSIIKYGITGKTEYKLTDAHHCTVGVKISGDVSLKVSIDGKEFELVTEGDFTTDKFAEQFNCRHSYAAHCDRILKNAGVDKNISNLNSLNRVPEECIRYANEITEGYLENNK